MDFIVEGLCYSLILNILYLKIKCLICLFYSLSLQKYGLSKYARIAFETQCIWAQGGRGPYNLYFNREKSARDRTSEMNKFESKFWVPAKPPLQLSLDSLLLALFCRSPSRSPTWGFTPNSATIPSKFGNFLPFYFLY